MNDIGRAQIVTSDAVFVDSYLLNSATGSFILIDPQTNATVAAGMIRGVGQATPKVSSGVVWQDWNISRDRREARQGHKGAVIWLTGLSGAGKSTIARAIEQQLFDSGHHTMLLDGDQLRHGLSGDLGFSPADRTENIRRAGEVARLFFETGALVLCAFVSPYRRDRDRVRALIPADRFVEVFVRADIDTCRARDTKGLYSRAASNDVQQMTGVSAPYEEPQAPEVIVDTTMLTIEQSVQTVIHTLRTRGMLR
jgi:bifunctional enzyme CysN/CysC